MKENWLDELIEFYDFVWKYGVSAHGSCINAELTKDFQDGGNKFEQMKNLIKEKWNSEEDAKKDYLAHLATQRPIDEFFGNLK